MIPATDKQKRALIWLARKYADTVQPELDKYGGSISGLTKQQASAILDVVNEKHPRDDEKKQEQKHEEQRQRLEQDEGQLELDEQKDEDDDEKQHQERMRRSGFRPGSKQEYIANALRENDMDLERTRLALKDKIGKIPALTFKGNTDDGRVELPMGDPEDDSQQATQYGRAVKTIFAVRRALLSGGEQGGEKKQEEHKREEKKEERKDEDRSKREAIEYLTWVRTVASTARTRPLTVTRWTRSA